MQNRKKVIPLDGISEDTMAAILDNVNTATAGMDIDVTQRYTADINVTAENIRKSYVLGSDELDDAFVSQYDLFNKKKSITRVEMQGDKVLSVTMITEY